MAVTIFVVRGSIAKDKEHAFNEGHPAAGRRNGSATEVEQS
jgi:hypothetical protein